MTQEYTPQPEITKMLKAVSEANSLFQDGKIRESRKKFENIKNEYPNNSYVYASFASTFLSRDSKLASQLVDEGLEVQSDNYRLLKLKADILANYNDPQITSQQLLANLDEALIYLKEAQYHFDTNKDKNELIKDLTHPLFPYTQGNWLSGKMELNSLEAHIVSFRNSVIVVMKVERSETEIIRLNNGIEKKLSDERIRIIELLGLFVAIFAFITVTVQITLSNTLIDSLVLISAIGFVLIIFLLALHMIVSPEKSTKSLIILITILIVLLFILPLVPSLLNGIKYYLKLS